MEQTTAETVKEESKALFYLFGLPLATRSDNGSPFAASKGLLGLTSFSAWFMYLGIVPDRISPGSPYQNGSHERMHGDIKREIQGKTPGGTSANQAALDLWVEEYNTVRPHEALGMRAPSEIYTPSSRTYEGDDFEWAYPLGFETRRVSNRGCIKLSKKRHFLSTALRGLTVGVQQIEETEYTIWLGEFSIAVLETRLESVKPTDAIQLMK
ncbi:MAG: integrase core domain-containing protein [Coriobacteriia bacterium]|nr:integrase core domain-containing protein [Coriobacteriia bacterium]